MSGQEQDKVKDLKDIAGKIFSPLNDDTISKKLYGWGVENPNDEFRMISWLSRQIKDLPIEHIPQQDIEQAIVDFQEINSSLSEIIEFKSDDESSMDLMQREQREQILERLRNQIRKPISGIGKILPLLFLQSEEYKILLQQMQGHNKEMVNLFEKAEKDFDEIRRVSRVAAGKAGAAAFTKEFSHETECLEKRARNWLWPTVSSTGLALLMPILSIFGIIPHVPVNTGWEAVYVLGGRLILISVFIYAAVWSGRIYLANKHLASVNKHRAISLQTLQAFHHAAEDATAKDAVVLEAARAVYENVPSGYIGRSSSGHGTTSRIVEIIKGTTGTSSVGE